MKTFETNTRARFAETDASGIVYYNNFFVYFELGRIEMFRELGLTYDRRVPIVEARCRYRSPAYFDDLLEIQTWVEEVRTKAFRMGQRILRRVDGAEPVLLAEGHTVMVHTDESRAGAPLPPNYRQALESAL